MVDDDPDAAVPTRDGGGHDAAAASRFALPAGPARDLETTPAGADLARRIAALVPAGADDATLVEAIAGCERLAAWASATQARLVSEVLARRSPAPSPGPLPDDLTAFEIQARLSITRYGAEAKVALAQDLDEFPLVADALARGDIDTHKARILLDPALSLTSDQRHDIHRDLVPSAPTLTGPQLRARMRRAALTANPVRAATRHQQAHATRTVTVEPAPDGMSWFSALLRCDDAEAARVYVDALAASAKTPTDTRTADQRRADAFSDLFRTLLDRGLDLEGLELPRTARRRPHLQVTVGAGTLLGLDESPGTLTGYGPIPADIARQIATDATWQALVTDATTGEVTSLGTTAYRPGAVLARTVIARDVTCTFMGCQVPADRCDLDHTPEFDPARAATEQTRFDTLYARCRSHHGAKTTKRWHASRDPATGDSIWTAPTGHVYRRPVTRPPGVPPPEPAALGEDPPPY